MNYIINILARYNIKNHELKKRMKIFLKKATEIVLPDVLKLEYNISIAATILLHRLQAKIFTIDEYYEMKKSLTTTKNFKSFR